jgi:hypothetical protein
LKREREDIRKEFFYSRPLKMGVGLWLAVVGIATLAAMAGYLLGKPFQSLLEGEATNAYTLFIVMILPGLSACFAIIMSIWLFYNALRRRPFAIIDSEGLSYRKKWRYDLIKWQEVCGVILFHGGKSDAYKSSSKIVLTRCQPTGGNVTIDLFLYTGDKDEIYKAIREEWRRRAPI